MGLGGVAKCFKVVLVIVNILFMCLGIALFAVGIVFKFNVSIITEKVLPLMNQVDLGTGMMLGTLTNSLDIVLICVGAFILCLALAGAIGACCEIKFLLVIYAVVVMLLMLTKLAAIILFFTMPQSEELLKSELETLITQYEGDTGGDITSAWNQLFYEQKCCGVTNYTDLEKGPWKNNKKQADHKITAYCCKGFDPIDPENLPDATCLTHPTSVNANIDKGCSLKVKETVTFYSTTLCYICIGIMVLELVAIVLAITVSCKMNSNKGLMV